jgi:hypothetical protein
MTTTRRSSARSPSPEAQREGSEPWQEDDGGEDPHEVGGVRDLREAPLELLHLAAEQLTVPLQRVHLHVERVDPVAHVLVGVVAVRRLRERGSHTVSWD